MAKNTSGKNPATKQESKLKTFAKLHPWKFSGIILAGVMVLIGIGHAIGIPVRNHNRKQAGIIDGQDKVITDISGENTDLKEDNANKDKVIDDLQEDIKNKDEIIAGYEKQQEFNFEGDETAVRATFGGYMKGKGGKIVSLKSTDPTENWSYQDGKLSLFFNGKAADGKTDTTIAITLNAETPNFDTDKVMTWLKEQAGSENPKDHPEVSVFATAQALGLQSETVNEMLVQLAEKKVQNAQREDAQRVADELVEEGSATITSDYSNMGETLFAIEKSETPDRKGNYKVTVKGLSRNADGKYIIDELDDQISVDEYADHAAIVAAAVTKYCEKYGIETPAPSTGVEAE